MSISAALDGPGTAWDTFCGTPHVSSISSFPKKVLSLRLTEESSLVFDELLLLSSILVELFSSSYVEFQTVLS